MNKNTKMKIIAVILLFTGIAVSYATYTSESARLNRLNDSKKQSIERYTDHKAQVRSEVDTINLTIAELRGEKEVKIRDIKTHEYCIDYLSWSLNTFDERWLDSCSIFEDVLKPSELFYTTNTADNCYVSQSEQDHYRKENGAMLATDISCWKQSEVYAPDLFGKPTLYKITQKTDQLLWDYVELQSGKYKWILGHTSLWVDDTEVFTGRNIWVQIASWALRVGNKYLTDKEKEECRLWQKQLCWYHTHIELWMLNDSNNWINISTTVRSKVLDNKRNGTLDTTVKIGDPIYFTSYDLWSVNQNDSQPCIWSSWKDLCQLAATKNVVAITKDVRELYGIKFWDVVTLKSSNWTKYSVVVEDEMNSRFRYSCIQKQWVCVKWDIARLNGKANLSSWIYTIIK